MNIIEVRLIHPTQNIVIDKQFVMVEGKDQAKKAIDACLRVFSYGSIESSISIKDLPGYTQGRYNKAWVYAYETHIMLNNEEKVLIALLFSTYKLEPLSLLA